MINAPPTIHCSYKILPNYAYGSGLRMIVDAPYLIQQAIEDAVTDFRGRDERE